MPTTQGRGAVCLRSPAPRAARQSLDRDECAASAVILLASRTLRAPRDDKATVSPKTQRELAYFCGGKMVAAMFVRRPSVILGLCLVFLAGFAGGCATSGTGNVPVEKMAERSAGKVDFEVKSSGGGSATIYINGEERGDTPAFIRLDADFAGNTVEDVLIKAVWNGGGNETEFIIPKGTKPQPIVTIGPSGERQF